MAIKNIIRIPVKKYICEYMFNFYPSKNGSPYLELKESYFLMHSIINFIKCVGQDNENYIPPHEESFIYLQTAQELGIIGLSERNAKRLGSLLTRYVDDIICQEILFYSSLPGFSVSESVLTALAKYDLASCRVDSWRRKFDRYTTEKKHHIDKVTVNAKVNKVLKTIYGEKFTKSLTEK